MKKLGIYVQVPFCQTKCTYCNFHTGVVAKERFAPYVEAVCREIRHQGELLRAAGVAWGSDKESEYCADTAYFGGGTPSLLEARQLQKILETMRDVFEANESARDKVNLGSSTQSSQRAPGRFVEVTLEADPETVEEEKAAAWVKAGINRVSLGVQSFVDKELAAAGRMHRRADIYRAVPILRAMGIHNIGFDLIAGLPHQTAQSWKRSLEELMA